MNNLSCIFLGIVFFSCTRSNSNKYLEPNKFLKDNRGAIYAELYEVVSKDSVCNDCERAYVFLDTSTLMGKFTASVKKVCEDIEVTFLNNFANGYNPKIFLSPGNKACIQDFDLIQFDTFRLFRIERYEKGILNLKFKVGDNLISSQDLRIINKTQVPPFQVQVFIKNIYDSALVIGSLKEYDVIGSVFGEEYKLKKVDTVTFKLVEEFTTDMMTMENYLNLFVVKNIPD